MQVFLSYYSICLVCFCLFCSKGLWEQKLQGLITEIQKWVEKKDHNQRSYLVFEVILVNRDWVKKELRGYSACTCIFQRSYKKENLLRKLRKILHTLNSQGI